MLVQTETYVDQRAKLKCDFDNTLWFCDCS